MSKYCKKCNCNCGCHPCRHTKFSEVVILKLINFFSIKEFKWMLFTVTIFLFIYIYSIK